MATEIIPKVALLAGEERFWPSAADDPQGNGLQFPGVLAVPGGIQTLEINLDMTGQERRDPATHVELVLFWRAQVADTWRVYSFLIERGRPSNEIRNEPFIRVFEEPNGEISFLNGKFIRLRLRALSAGSYGARIITG